MRFTGAAMPRRRMSAVSTLVLVLSLFVGCGRAPSMGLDKETFVTVDALFSAVCLKDEKQLDRNAGTLNKLHDDGRLPEAAHKALAAIISEAKSGGWEDAAETLREFMLDQTK
jgi:hypothetical protein